MALSSGTLSGDDDSADDDDDDDWDADVDEGGGGSGLVGVVTGARDTVCTMC